MGANARLRLTAAAVVVGLVAVPAVRARAVLEPSGHPLTTFAGDASVQTNFAVVDTFAEVRGLGVQSVGARAGQIVLAGGYQDGFDFHVALLRLNADGTQDFGFGSGGEVKSVVGSNDLAEDVVVQPDDKIVVAGFSDNSAMVLRYEPDGTLDTTFGGGDGVVTFQVLVGEQTRVQSVILQPDGKILLAGSAIVTASIPDPTPNEPPFSTPADRAVLVARLNANGTIDTTFGGGDGYATINISTPEPIPGFPDPSPPFVGGSEAAEGLALQADGKIVFVGNTRNVAGSSCNQQISTDTESLIGRLNTNGTPDTTFDGDGMRTVSLGTTGNCPDDAFNNVTVQPDGKLVAVGYANTTQDSSTNAKNNVSVARFNADGSFDNTFSGDGRLATPIASTAGFLSDVAQDVTVLADGRILVGASTDGGGPGPIPGTFVSENDFAALRYNADGTLDSTFSGDGIGVYDFSENDTFDAMVVDSSGRPLLAGYSYVVDQFVDPLLAVARIGTNGELDATFNSAGSPPGTFFKALQGGSVDLGAGVVRQGVGANAGKLVVVGSTDVGSQTDVGLVRYTTAGALDASFSGDGKATGDDSGRNDAPGAAAVQTDDKVVVVGTSFGTSGAPRATVMRFNANSGLDTTFDGDGIATLTVGANANQWDAVTVAPDGDLYVGGTVSDVPADWDFLVARYNADGTPDNAFNGNGRLRLSLGAGVDQVFAITLQPDGKVLVAGSTFVGQASQFAVARLNANGTVDSTFGGGDGIVVTPIGGGAFPRNEITGIAVQADGRIVVGGNGNDGGGNTNNVIRLARYLPDGTLDASFDGDGIVTTNLAGDRFDRVGGIALQHDEKVVVFGYSQQLFVTRDDFVIARYNWDDGSLDTTFGDTNTGATVLAASPGSDQAAAGVLYPDGSMAVGGTVGSSDFGAARFAGDPAPILPGAPSLSPASDSGISNSDRITNDNTPELLGSSCNVGETTVLRIDGSLGSPLSRSLCRTGAYAVTVAAPLADGNHSLGAFSRNGFGDTADTATVTITVDTVANPPTIDAPVEGATIDLPPNPTISGTVDETIPGAVVEVREGGATVCTAIADASGAWSCLAALEPATHTITARQTDIAGNTSVDSAGRTFDVRSPTTTAVVSNVDPSVYGQQVTFTATVTALAGTATGTVDFVVDGVSRGTAALDLAGLAALTVPVPPGDPLEVGEHPVTASFLGSQYYLASSGNLGDDQTVDPADTTVSITTPITPTPYGASTTFTFTVVPTAPGAGTPTGQITATVDGVPQVLDLVAGQATLSTSELLPGTHAIAATYGGESRFNASPEASLEHEVSLGITATNVTSSANPSTFGQSVTFTATVAAVAPAPGVPTGTVLFSIDGGAGTEVALDNGVATLTTSTLGAGVHTVEVDYGGDARFDISAGGLAGGQQVQQGAALTSISAQPSPSVFGESVTITVTATPVDPSPGPLAGTGSLVIDGGAPVPLTFTDGVATHTVADLAIGDHTLDASFAGNADVAGSSATQVVHTVDQAATSTLLTAAPSPSAFGELVTFTATVAAVAPGVGTPTGTVDFAVDGGPPVSQPLTGGIATLDVGGLAAGNHTVTAAYSGDANFQQSSDELDAGQDVVKAASIATITSSLNPSGFGEQVDFTITVAAVAPSTATPTGIVDVSIDGGPPTPLALIGGAALLSLDTLPVGAHVVTVVYGGDADHAGSTAQLDPPQVVDEGASTTTLTSSAPATTFGSPITFTATVAAVAPAPGTPTGTVAFTIDGGTPVDVPLVAGVAQLTTSLLAAGAHTVSATYTGDGSFTGSAADLAGGHVVGRAATTTALTSSRDPSTYGEPVTFTITITAPTSTPTGTVAVRIDGGAPIPVPLVAGVATTTVDDLAVGEHQVVASYGGDGNHDPSSAALANAQTVGGAATVISLAAAPDPAIAGQTVTLTASVTSPAAPAAQSALTSSAVPQAVVAPTGTVMFMIDGVATVVPLNGGVAVHAVTLAAGAHTVIATYSGDANHLPATASLAGGLVVQAQPTSTTPGGTGGTGGTGRLPATGSDGTGLVPMALALLVGGAALIRVRRPVR